MKKEYLQKGRVNQKLKTREKILSSAQELLSTGKKFTLEEVAEKAGVSRATIYRYYSNVDVLSAEAGIDINTLSPEAIFENLKGLKTSDKILGVQAYYNNLTMDHESAFRNYLSIILGADSKNKRGARRTKTLKLVLDELNLTKQQANDLTNLFTVLMGIEPLIVTKDVCGLDNQQSKKLLRWGMQLLLKGIAIDQDK